jgi:UDP-N-acetylmuramoylalanine--D-glutamate ligase
MNVEEIPMRGRHNWENVLAAAAVANLSGASLSQLAAAVRSFSGVEHRIEFVRTLNGVTYYNDSKATNVDAALKAIDSFSGRLFLILGGKDKGSDYTPLVAPLKPKAAAVLLIGDAARKIAAAFGSELPAVPCGDLKTAVEMAHREAKAGDTVLLAPACASFDQFDNYEHRGRYFKQLVAGLGANEEKS